MRERLSLGRANRPSWRFALLLLVGLVGLTAGCNSSPCSTGWKFEVGKPGLVHTPAVYAQQSGPVGIAPLAAYPALPAARAVLPQPLEVEQVAPPRVLAAAPPPSCNLDEICRKLDIILSRLAAPSARMPSAVP